LITVEHCDSLIVGSGPAGLGAAFHLTEANPGIKIIILDKEKVSSGGLRNDCKMNFTFPTGFPLEYWDRAGAEELFPEMSKYLHPEIMTTKNLSIYQRRAERLGVRLMEIRQAHYGTDGGIILIRELVEKLKSRGVNFSLQEEMVDVNKGFPVVVTDRREITFRKLIIAPGRRGFSFLQKIMDKLEIHYIDNIVDIGLRVETREENYPIVRDYYDPKFHFPDKVRTFCTNSRAAYVVKEKYSGRVGKAYFSVNGHAFSEKRKRSGLVNFAMLKTVGFTRPLASGQEFAEMLGQQAMLMGGGKPLMQRVGDFRLGKRSNGESFTGDLYDFEPSLKSCTPGDISLAAPGKIMRAIWKAMKMLDTITPGLLHPATIMYYPEIKLYANKPQFKDEYFQVRDNIYLIGDGAGTSRGITGAWASGIRAAKGILKSL